MSYDARQVIRQALCEARNNKSTHTAEIADLIVAKLAASGFEIADLRSRMRPNGNAGRDRLVAARLGLRTE